jgi:hypothetical protein
MMEINPRATKNPPTRTRLVLKGGFSKLITAVPP